MIASFGSRFNCRIGSWLGLALIGIVALQCSTNVSAQVVLGSRPQIHWEVDVPVCITDYLDSVYVVTQSGWVLAYDTTLSYERVMEAATSMHVSSAFVFEGALFFQNESGRFLIQDGETRQFMDLSPGFVGRDASMMPIVVTPTGTYEIRRGTDGRFAPIRTTFDISYNPTIREIVRIGPCVVATYHETVGSTTPPASLHRADGTTVPLTYDILSSSSLIPYANGYLIESGWQYARLITDVCSDTPGIMSLVGNDGRSLRPGRATQRTHSAAPYALLHWSPLATTSDLYIFDDAFPRRQLWFRDSAYNHHMCSVSDVAVYSWSTDGWIVRYSFVDRAVHVRPTRMTRGRHLQVDRYGVDRLLTGFVARISTGTKFRDSIIVGSQDMCHYIPDSVLVSNDIQSISSEIAAEPLSDTAWIVVLDRHVVVGPIHGVWTVVPIVVAQNPILASLALDSASYLRFDQLFRIVDGAVRIRRITVETNAMGDFYPTTSYSFGSGYLFVDNGFVRYASFTSGGDTVRVDSIEVLSLYQYSVVPPHGDTLTVFRTIEGDSVFPDFTRSIREIRRYRFSSTMQLIDSTIVQPRNPYAHYSRQFFGDTLYYIDFRDGLIKSLWPGEEDKWRRFVSIPNAASFPRTRARPVFRALGPTTSLMSVNGRLFEIDVASELPVVTVNDQSMLDVAFQHIFMMNVYPNPGTTTATLEMRRHGSSGTSATELFLVDMLGNRVRDYSTSADFMFTVGTIGRATLDYAGIPSGQYLLVMRTSGVTTSKLVSISR